MLMKRVIQEFIFHADNPVETGKCNSGKSVFPLSNSHLPQYAAPCT